ncbi:histone deacetylase family protein [Caldicellulosiruptor naganoensis]|uniref:Histone deacetylase n=1 Tax=Caldicellulosiruptor naganoensis TaxID=29324 RepID=A0ABY7BJJ4_9FIRM|nr:histone deacetylase [Caldicellulosiruptor naganoensis]WAM32593.1 histone deacetylase [Caldicellulosiruptor naganoensis]
MQKAQNKLGLILFPAFDWKITPTHPEREERLLYTIDQIEEEGLFDYENIFVYNPEVIDDKYINLTHFCIPDVDSIVTISHKIAAGSSITIAKKVLSNEVTKGFALIRPPGHHAHRITYGDRGFCIINNEAIMVEYLRKEHKTKKIAIIDTDCHHGDGTQDIFWNDKDVLFISLHQDGRTLYPGSGFTNEIGGPAAIGYTLNLPLPPYTSDEGFLYCLENLILPILEEFKPEIIINSAGQDNHYSDPLTNMNFSAQGYAKLTEKLNPHISVLEGGYSVESALPYVNLGIIFALAGIDYSNIKEPDYDYEKLRQSTKISEYIKRLCENVYTIWKNKEQTEHDLKKKYQKYFTRKKSIYYDTMGFLEQQLESIKICNKCSGLITIESYCLNYRVFAITIPHDACDECYDEGYKLFATTDIGSFSHIILQDKRNFEFHKKEYSK